MATLVDYTFEYNGLTMGAGTNYSVIAVDGLEDLNARMGDVGIPREDGDIAGLHTAAGKSITMNILVKGVKGTQALRDSVQALHTAFQHRTLAIPFYWREPGFADERFLYVRPTGRAQMRDAQGAHQPSIMVRVKASDPRVYADAQEQANMTVYSASGGGMDFDEIEFGMEFAEDTSSEVIATNVGNANAYPLLRFYGGLTGTVTEVSITNSTTGQASVFTTTLLIGQILSADMRRIITADTADTPYIELGGSTRYGDWNLPREPFYLAPGDNELRFEVTAGSSTNALCVATYRPTWL